MVFPHLPARFFWCPSVSFRGNKHQINTKPQKSSKEETRKSKHLSHFFGFYPWVWVTKKIPGFDAGLLSEKRETCGARLAHRRCGFGLQKKIPYCRMEKWESPYVSFCYFLSSFSKGIMFLHLL